MKKSITVIFIVALGLSLAFGDIPSVSAQETKADEFTLDEITVTAQKREENQQKVAIAMEVISSDTIKELGRTDIDQILSNVTNLFVTRESGGIKISLRGIANDNGIQFSGAQASTPTVALNFDGISSARMDQGTNLYDLERVEVLYGPQATLYSTNTPGGIVNVITAQPKLDKFEGSGTLEYGNYNLLHTEGVVNAPINDTMAVRAAFSTSTHKGYISNGTADEDAKSARLRYLFQASERFSFTASGEYQRTSNLGFAGVAQFAKQSDVDNPWTPAPGMFGAPPTTPRPTYSDRHKIYGQFEADAGIGTITFLPSYVRLVSSVAGEDMFGYPTMQNSRMKEKSFELRMGSKADSPFTYIFGLSHYSVTDRSHTTTDNPPTNSWNDLLMDTKSDAAYGNVTYPFTDVFRVTGGLRYSRNKYYTIMYRWPDDYMPGTMSIEEGIMEYNGMDHKVGIEYYIRENVMFYADTSTSFRTQGMAFKDIRDMKTGARRSEPNPPEKLTAYNAGLKSRFFENRLQLNVAGYFYDYRDYWAFIMQGTRSRVDINGDGDYDDKVNGIPETNFTIDDNSKGTVGDAEAYGMDVMTSMIITNKDKLDLSISYAHKKFTHMFFDWMDTTNELGVPDLDLSGKAMTMSPAWTINANYSHNFSLANGGVLTARVDSKYVSEYQVSWNNIQMNVDMFTYAVSLSDNTPYNKQEPYHMSNFTMVYADPSGKWTFSGYVKNIENYAAKLGSFMNSMNISSPRTYGGILTIRF